MEPRNMGNRANETKQAFLFSGVDGGETCGVLQGEAFFSLG